MDTPESRVEILRAEAEEVKSYLAGLPPEAWNRPSACRGWTVADVVGHVVGQDFATTISRGINGDLSPLEGRPPMEEHDEDRFAEGIFQRAFTTRERLGDNLLPTLIERLDEAVRVFSTIKPHEWDALCYWPPGPEPVRTLLDMRISELTMHAWDIRSRLDDDYHLSAASVGVLMDTVNRAVRRAFRPDPGLTSPVRHRFTITSPVSAAADIVLSRDGGKVEPASDSAADVNFRCNGRPTCW